MIDATRYALRRPVTSTAVESEALLRLARARWLHLRAASPGCNLEILAYYNIRSKCLNNIRLDTLELKHLYQTFDESAYDKISHLAGSNAPPIPIRLM